MTKLMKCINCGYDEPDHERPVRGGPCFVFQASNGEKWFWLSFVDPNKLPGDKFLGVAIVKGHTLKVAIQNSHALGINPGGEVASLPIPDDKLDMFPENMRHRLLSRAEAESL